MFIRTSIVILLINVVPLLLTAQQKTLKNTHPVSTTTSSVKRGKEVYAMRCLACHQVDGSGVPNLNPPLIRTKWVMGSKAVLIHQVLAGSSGKIEIDGDRFQNTMPPIPSMTDQEIADVLTYVRASFKNKFSAVSVAEVKAVRSKLGK